MKDKDHDKYAAIGESDRMTLKFIKVTPVSPAARSDPLASDAGAPAHKKTMKNEKSAPD